MNVIGSSCFTLDLLSVVDRGKWCYKPSNRRAAKWILLSITAYLAVGLVGLARGAEEIDASTLAGLKKARECFERMRVADEADQPGIREELSGLARSASKVFLTVPINEKYGTNRFVKVTLNRFGTGFDGVRFTAPPSGDRDMVFVFARPIPSAGYAVNIISMDGPMDRLFEAFEGYEGRYDEFARWGRIKDRYRPFIGSYPGGRIKAGREYAIWFAFRDDKPIDLFLGINLVETGKPLGQLIDRERALGLVVD